MRCVDAYCTVCGFHSVSSVRCTRGHLSSSVWEGVDDSRKMLVPLVIKGIFTWLVIMETGGSLSNGFSWTLRRSLRFTLRIHFQAILECLRIRNGSESYRLSDSYSWLLLPISLETFIWASTRILFACTQLLSPGRQCRRFQWWTQSPSLALLAQLGPKIE